jgi:hypothetical protein
VTDSIIQVTLFVSKLQKSKQRLTHCYGVPCVRWLQYPVYSLLCYSKKKKNLTLFPILMRRFLLHHTKNYKVMYVCYKVMYVCYKVMYVCYKVCMYVTRYVCMLQGIYVCYKVMYVCYKVCMYVTRYVCMFSRG